MTSIADIYIGAERLINLIIRTEVVEQGHRLTGALEDSLDSKYQRKGKEDIMQGFAIYYTQFVNDGLGPESASFKQVPFLIEFFKKRGLQETEAKGAAFATVKTWMKEGMPTQASKRFSKTGSRTNMIENSITGNEAKIDEYMTNSFDFAIEEKFQQTKSETI